ncbi:hypothetical protein PFISCL1PPCAC_10730 [Pristionchus fissidentatus]|uniref:EF-hand domain-containing protein n=1 Tax=Pristionchus fissidentatus TaxID=1538716 RepID=A0AAV5VMD3_9BILA|nr:hypothetical protein PFISCL1PPCAC_10730 [Pristionchus fissidentatus]
MPLPEGLVDEYRKQFSQIDKDDSGFVTQEELSSLLSQMGHSEADVKEKFRELDQDIDKKISFAEFIDLMEKLSLGRDSSELEEVFKLADEEGMGFIDYDTLKRMLIELIGSSDRVSHGLRALRINEDEHIDCEQFIEIANSI